MRKAFTAAAVLATLACVGTAVAQDAPAPDLKGQWIGAGEAVVMGNPDHHSGGATDQPRASGTEFTITIETQEGRRFWGALASQYGSDPLAGVIGFDGKTILMQADDGTAHATLVDADTLEVLYSHRTKESVVVSVNRYKRRK